MGRWKALLGRFLDQFVSLERCLFGDRFLDRFWAAPGRPGTPQMAPQTAPRRDQDAPQKTIKNRTPKGPKRDPKRGPKWDQKSRPKAAACSPDLGRFLVSGPFSSKSCPGGVLGPPLGALGPSWSPKDLQKRDFHALLGPKTLQKLTFF